MNKEPDIISGKIKPIFEKIKTDKRLLLLIILGIVGFAFILFPDTDEAYRTDTKENISAEQVTDKEGTEKAVTGMIESIKGAGKAKIMITYECDSETVFAKDTAEKSRDNENDIKNEYIIIDGDNGETGLRVKSIYPRVLGVAVICEGGDDPIVKERIYSLISALFDINTNSISVTVMA